MDLKGKKLAVIRGAGLIGSHTVDHLVRKDVDEIIAYDNMVRDGVANLTRAMASRRCRDMHV